MRRVCVILGLAVAALLWGSPAPATTIVAPEDAGELALSSDGVFLARAGASRTVPRGALLYTVTELEVLESVSGSPAPGELVEVVVPGGSLDGRGFAVAGAPRFDDDN